MRKKHFLLIVALIGCCFYSAANIFNDEEFDNKLSGKVGAVVGTYKMSKHTESDGNNCARLEIAKIEQSENGKKTNIAFFIGEDNSEPGFSVEPDTEYRFSLMLKGNQPKATVRIEETYDDSTSFWEITRKKVNVDFQVPIKIETDNWNKTEGTFKTSSQAKRAYLIVQFWWDEKYGPIMYKKGDYILIDKVVLKKVPNKLTALATGKYPLEEVITSKEKIIQITEQSEIPIIDGDLNDKCWQNLPVHSNFTSVGEKGAAETGSEFKIFRNGENIYLGIKCFEPNIDKLQASIATNGIDVWKDDVVEIFFAPAFESSFLQFVISAKGGRYIGDGTKELMRYEQWEGIVSKSKDFWSVELKIPYSLMWDKITENSIDYRMNVCRQRKQSKELSSWAPMTRSFQDVNEFGKTFFGDVEKWSEVQIAELAKDIAKLPTSSQDTLAKKLTKLSTNNIGILYNQLEAIKEQIKFLKVADRKFVVTEVAQHRATRIPFLPDQLANPPEKITLTAAINEVKSIPLAITNLTDKIAEYQILLCSEKINRADEKPGLESKSARFPLDKIKCLRAIRVKETDEKGTVIRFDPLVEIDRSYTLTAPGKDSALFYYKFNCQDIKPGIYNGFLHVIPLSEPTLAKGSATELTQIQSIPFELNVLPIELSQKLRTPLFYFGIVKDKSIALQMLEEGVTYFPVSVWGVSATFDNKGNIKNKNIDVILENIAQQQKWANEYCPGTKIKHVVIYSLYNTFMKRFGKNQFNVGTPEWMNAYKNWIKLFIEVRKKAGLTPSDFIVQIQDEPAHNKNSPSFSVILEASKMAKEVAPDLTTMLTLSSIVQAKELYQFIPYIDVYIFWNPLLNRKGYLGLVEKLRNSNKQVWMYRCDTGINSDLYSYYRLHAWRGEYGKVDVNALWTAYGAPNAYPVSWRVAGSGNFLMLYGDVFSTVRNESFITGFNDLRYYDKLAKVTKLAKEKGKNPELISEAEKFLQESPGNIINHSRDFRFADQFRNNAVDLILKIQNNL